MKQIPITTTTKTTIVNTDAKNETKRKRHTNKKYNEVLHSCLHTFLISAVAVNFQPQSSFDPSVFHSIQHLNYRNMMVDSWIHLSRPVGQQHKERERERERERLCTHALKILLY